MTSVWILQKNLGQNLGHRHFAGHGGHDGGGDGGVGGGGDPSTQPRVCVTVVMVRGSQGVSGLGQPRQAQVGEGLDNVGLSGARPVVNWGDRWREGTWL